jgi:1,2-diacylglycerol 3-beta-galactosyltransferase
MTGCQKKLLVLMSNTGGGHRSVAEAIAEATTHLYGDAVQTEIVDALAHHTPFPLNRVDRLYAPAVSHAPWLWQLLWWLTDSPQRARRFFAALRPWVGPTLRRLFLASQPDAVVSVHPAFNHLGVWTLRQMRWQTPFVTVVTDLVRAHPFWLCPQVDLCLTPTKAARRDAFCAGVPPEKTQVTGLPVSLKFCQGRPEKQLARARLDLCPDRPVVLLMGGGEGVGRLYKVARAVAEARPPAQMVVIAGRNEKLRRRLAATGWEIPTRIVGFVANIPQWMAAADVLVTKAGPGVISEAFIAGLPLVLSGAIPGQEVPNVGYVVARGAGVAETDPTCVAAWLAQRLRPGDETLAHMAAAARRLARPEAALQVVRQIVTLLTAEPLPGRVNRQALCIPHSPVPSPGRQLQKPYRRGR